MIWEAARRKRRAAKEQPPTPQPAAVREGVAGASPAETAGTARRLAAPAERLPPRRIHSLPAGHGRDSPGWPVLPEPVAQSWGSLLAAHRALPKDPLGQAGEPLTGRGPVQQAPGLRSVSLPPIQTAPSCTAVTAGAVSTPRRLSRFRHRPAAPADPRFHRLPAPPESSSVAALASGSESRRPAAPSRSLRIAGFLHSASSVTPSLPSLLCKTLTRTLAASGVIQKNRERGW
jgi:hypothetical protein